MFVLKNMTATFALLSSPQLTWKPCKKMSNLIASGLSNNNSAIENLIYDILNSSDGRFTSPDDWSNFFRTSCAVNNKEFSVKNLHVPVIRIMKALSAAKHSTDATSLIDFVDSELTEISRKPNFVGPYIRVRSEAVLQSTSLKQDGFDVEKWLARLNLKGPFDLSTASDVLMGIALLKDWKCRSDILLATMGAGNNAYDAHQLARIRIPLLYATVRDSAKGDFVSLLQNVLLVAKRAQSSAEASGMVNLAVAQACVALQKFSALATSSSILSTLLKEMELFTIDEYGSGYFVLQKNIASSLASTCKLVGYDGFTFYSQNDSTVVSDAEKCSSCGIKFPALSLSPHVFRSIKTEFFKTAFSGFSSSRDKYKSNSSDNFLRSSPAELASFLEFLEGKKFDIVIDGLNVSHRHRMPVRKKILPKQRGQVVLKLAQYYAVSEKKRVLVVAKKHVERSWSFDVIKGLRALGPKVKLFLSDNLSDDDSLLIFAALSSGPNAKIISHDDFRQPAAILAQNKYITDDGVPLKLLFRKWLVSRHLIFLWWDEKANAPCVREPRQYVLGITRAIKTSKNSKELTLHIAYESDEDSEDPSAPKGGVDGRFLPTRLLCLKAQANGKN